MPLGLRDGAMRVQHNFPVDGEYRFNVLFPDGTLGLYTGSLENEATLVLMIDGKVMFRKPIGGWNVLMLNDRKAGDGSREIAGRFRNVSLPIQAGVREVVVGFIDRSRFESPGLQAGVGGVVVATRGLVAWANEDKSGALVAGVGQRARERMEADGVSGSLEPLATDEEAWTGSVGIPVRGDAYADTLPSAAAPDPPGTRRGSGPRHAISAAPGADRWQRGLPAGCGVLALADRADAAAAALRGGAGGRDSLDGYVARRFGQVTTLGKILDPTVDRLVLGTAIAAAGVGAAHSAGVVDVPGLPDNAPAVESPAVDTPASDHAEDSPGGGASDGRGAADDSGAPGDPGVDGDEVSDRATSGEPQEDGKEFGTSIAADATSGTPACTARAARAS